MDYCSSCRFFYRNGGPVSQYGQCRRFPEFVDRHQAEGCGEHKPVQIQPAKPEAKLSGD